MGIRIGEKLAQYRRGFRALEALSDLQRNRIARSGAVGLRQALSKAGGRFGRRQGGQRSYFFSGAVTSYISDDELVSGGTTYRLTEVADPIVRFAETGVVLDVTIARTEETIHLETLETITGQSIGNDAGKWRDWWKTSGEAQFAEALKASRPQPDARPGRQPDIR